MKVYIVRLDASLTGENGAVELSERMFDRLLSSGVHPDLAGPDDADAFTFWLTVRADAPEDAAAAAASALRAASAEESGGHPTSVEILALQAQQADAPAERALATA